MNTVFLVTIFFYKNLKFPNNQHTVLNLRDHKLQLKIKNIIVKQNLLEKVNIFIKCNLNNNLVQNYNQAHVIFLFKLLDAQSYKLNFFNILARKF